jgi:CcmD family protein
MNNYVYLFWGYNVIWALIGLYVLFLAVRLNRVGRRLDRLEGGLRSSDDD